MFIDPASTKSRIFHVYLCLPRGPRWRLDFVQNVQKLPVFEKYLTFEKIFFHILGGSSKWGNFWTNGQSTLDRPSGSRTPPRPRPPVDPRPRRAREILDATGLR